MKEILDEHICYLADTRRLDRYRAAVSATVAVGDIVADVGCGTGILGLLCLQAGAGRVEAIDASGAIDIARQSLASAGFAERVHLIHGSSFQIALPERVDVVICDHVGYFGFDYGLVETLADARRRFLKASGRMIPDRLRLHVAAVQFAPCQQLVNAWAAPEIPVEFQWLRQYSVNSKYAVNLAPPDLLSAPAELGCIDLATDNPEFFSWSATLTASSDGIMHGVAGWFDCRLADAVWMTNSPVAADAITRPQAFLPLEHPVSVATGDHIAVTVMTRPGDQLLAWDVQHSASGQRFSHSTRLGDLLRLEQLQRTRPDYVPRLSDAALARRVVLGYFDGKRTVAQIRADVKREHPHLLPTETATDRLISTVLAGHAV